jgi:hypothetical protein
LVERRQQHPREQRGINYADARLHQTSLYPASPPDPLTAG